MSTRLAEGRPSVSRWSRYSRKAGSASIWDILIGALGGTIMADQLHTMTMDQLHYLAIDQTGQLYWHGELVRTSMVLPTFVNVAIIIGALAALISAVVAAIGLYRGIVRERLRERELEQQKPS